MNKMKLTELLKGKKVKVTTDAKVDVELEIKEVIENVTTRTQVLEPDTKENDWWGTSITHRDVKYIVRFVNGFSKTYNSIEAIPLIE